MVSRWQRHGRARRRVSAAAVGKRHSLRPRFGRNTAMCNAEHECSKRRIREVPVPGALPRALVRARSKRLGNTECGVKRIFEETTLRRIDRRVDLSLDSVPDTRKLRERGEQSRTERIQVDMKPIVIVRCRVAKVKTTAYRKVSAERQCQLRNQPLARWGRCLLYTSPSPRD